MIEINLHHLTMAANLCWLACSHLVFITLCDMLVAVFQIYWTLKCWYRGAYYTDFYRMSADFSIVAKNL